MNYTSYIVNIGFAVCSGVLYCAPFAHDRAAYAAQKGDWKKSGALLDTLVNDCPDNPEVVYDAGVVAYKQGQFEQAKAYFANSVQACKQHQNGLKEQSYFNLGNTNVQLNELEQAIENYKKALEINANNERVKHNLEVVSKMLEQQKLQQQPQKNDNKKNQDKQKHDKSDQQQQQKDKQEKKDSDKQQDKQNQQRSDQKQSDQKNEQKKQDSQQQKQDDQSQQNQQQQQDKQKQSAAKQQNQKEEQQKSEKQKQEQQQHAEQQADNQEKQEKNEREGQPVEQAQQAGKLNMQLAQILNEREKKDAHLNKQMIRDTVKNNMMGQQGENCW